MEAKEGGANLRLCSTHISASPLSVPSASSVGHLCVLQISVVQILLIFCVFRVFRRPSLNNRSATLSFVAGTAKEDVNKFSSEALAKDGQ